MIQLPPERTVIAALKPIDGYDWRGTLHLPQGMVTITLKASPRLGQARQAHWYIYDERGGNIGAVFPCSNPDMFLATINTSPALDFVMRPMSGRMIVSVGAQRSTGQPTVVTLRLEPWPDGEAFVVNYRAARLNAKGAVK